MRTKKMVLLADPAMLGLPIPSLPVEQAEALYHFLPEAERLAPSQIEPCDADLGLTQLAVRMDVDALRPYAERLRRERPAIPVDDLLALPDLLRALVAVAAQVPPEGAALLGRPVADVDPTELRDRLWTLVVERLQAMRTARAYLFGDDVAAASKGWS